MTDSEVQQWAEGLGSSDMERLANMQPLLCRAVKDGMSADDMAIVAKQLGVLGKKLEIALPEHCKCSYNVVCCLQYKGMIPPAPQRSTCHVYEVEDES